MLDHRFTGPPFTVGIEEELMILDAESLDLAQGIHTILDQVPIDMDGHVKPELMKSVLEVATPPCPDAGRAGEHLRRLRRQVAGIAERNGMLIGGAGTHPFAQWADQEIVEYERYEELVDELQDIARQEMIFGIHVHVGIDGPDRAIYVADGIRRYLPLMLALSANSPFWQGRQTGMASARTPVFRAFPRVGVPPHYGNWETFSHRVNQMVRGGAIADYTYLWWDVRAHPQLGTVETRIFDQQTRVDYTIGLAAFVACLAHRLSALHGASEPLVEYPTELIDDNKVRAAVGGMETRLIDFHRGERVAARELARRMLDELRGNAQELGCEAELGAVEELVDLGTGSDRQLEIVRTGADLVELVRRIVEHSRS